MTIRSRFILWFLFLLAPLLLLSGYFEHRRLESFYLAVTTARLQSEAQDFLRAQPVAAPPLPVEAARRLVDAFRKRQVSVIIYSPNGEFLSASANIPVRKIKPPDMRRITLSETSECQVYEESPSRRYLVAWVPLPSRRPVEADGLDPPPPPAPAPPSPSSSPPSPSRPSDAPGALGIIAPLSALDQTIRQDAPQWIGRLAIVLGIAAVALWVLIQAILAPLERMAQIADSIADGDRSLRMKSAYSLKRGRDELTRLSVAYDRMIDAILSSESEMRRFLAEASHELRTPLTAVGGYIDILERGAGEKPEDRKRIRKAIREEVDRMSRLVSELMILTRLQGSMEKEELLSVEVSPLPILESLLERARLRAPDRRLSILTGDSSPSDWIAKGDPDRLRQAFGNLIDNALVHARGGLEIRLSARDGYAEIAFEDEGPPISPELRDRLFGRFVKGKDSPGSGLGLSIVKAILQAHGGDVILETSERGNRFVVRLPLSEEASKAKRFIEDSSSIH